VAEQELDCSEVSPAFEQMSRETVPQRVHGHRLREAGINSGVTTGLLKRTNAEMTVGFAPREQPLFRANHPPVCSQDREESGREHNVAVLATFTLVNTDDHTLAVDIGDLQSHNLGNAQAGSVRGHKGSAVLKVGNSSKELFHLSLAQDNGKLARLARIGEMRLSILFGA
jgi:hypothetical protein